MDLILLCLCIISIIYCCDVPVISGFEIFVNDHNSMLYGIGLSLIAAYIFYIFLQQNIYKTIIPRNIRFKQTQHFICAKLYDVEISMNKIFSLLQGKA